MLVLPIGRCKIMRRPPPSEDSNTGEWKVAFKKCKKDKFALIDIDLSQMYILFHESQKFEKKQHRSTERREGRANARGQLKWPSTGLMISIHLLLVVCLSAHTCSSLVSTSSAEASTLNDDPQSSTTSPLTPSSSTATKTTTTTTKTTTLVPNSRESDRRQVMESTDSASINRTSDKNGDNDDDGDLLSVLAATETTTPWPRASSTSSAFDDFVSVDSNGPTSFSASDSANQLQTPTMSTTTISNWFDNSPSGIINESTAALTTTTTISPTGNQEITEEHRSGIVDFSNVDETPSEQIPFPSASVILDHDESPPQPATSTVDSLIANPSLVTMSSLDHQVDILDDSDANGDDATTILPTSRQSDEANSHRQLDSHLINLITSGPGGFQNDNSPATTATQLVRSRKSSPDKVETKPGSDNNNSKSQSQTQTMLTKLAAANSTSDEKGPFAEVMTGTSNSPPNPLDYDDFDLDYQLKLNASIDSLLATSGSQQGLNKRDQDGLNGIAVKPPAWSALVMQQPHVFTPSPLIALPTTTSSGIIINATTQSSSDLEQSTGSGNSTTSQRDSQQHAQPMLPPLLTVHSTQLTSQELQKIKPQFLFYQDNYDQSYLGDLQSGDLMATASGGGLPAASFAVVALNGSQLSLAPINSTGGANQHISLMNGSPVMRQNMLSNLMSLRNKSSTSMLQHATTESPPLDSSTVTTIVVDNLAPTELPPVAQSAHGSQGIITSTFATPTHSSSTSRTNPPTPTPPQSTTTTSAPINSATESQQSRGSSQQNGTGTSQSNQWFNYPHPNLHHNPLLLHHILNKPTAYTQQMVANNQMQHQKQQSQQRGESQVNLHPFNLFQPATLSSTPATSASIGTSTTQPPPTTTTTTTTTTTMQPSTTTYAVPTSTNSPAHLGFVASIIERPALVNEFIQRQPVSVNRTQLQMQLNEMRALAAASRGQMKANLSPPSQASQQPVKLATTTTVMQSPTISSKVPAQLATTTKHLALNVKLPEQQPVVSPSATMAFSHLLPQNLASFNMLHHLLGQNLYDSHQYPSNNNNNQQQQPPVTANPGNRKLVNSMVLGPNQMPTIPTGNPIAKIPFLASQQAHMHSPIAPLRPLREPASGLHSNLVGIATAPSLIQQVYTPRPASMLPNGTNFLPSLNYQKPQVHQLNGQFYKLPNQLHPFGHSMQQQGGRLVLPQTGSGGVDANEAASSPVGAQITMSEEDMSTYVSQLASLGTTASQLPVGETPKWTPFSMNGSTSSSIASSDLMKFVESLLAKKEESPQHQQQQQQQQQYHSQMEQILKQAKLVGIPDEVQAQIYQDLNLPAPPSVSGSGNFKSSKTNWHQARPSGESSNQMSSFLTQGGFNDNSLTGNISSNSTNGHQEQQKREREQLIAAILAATSQRQTLFQSHQPQDEQKIRQSAFIEALKQNVAKLQHQVASSSVDSSQSTTATSGNNLASASNHNPKLLATGAWSTLAGTEYSLLPNSSSIYQPSTDFDDTIGGRPIPEWLEKQIMQDSFVHESARVHPFGQTTKSTHIGPPLADSSLFSAGNSLPLIGSHRPPSIRLTPLSPASAHLLTAASHNVRPIFQAPGAAPLTSHYSLSPAPPKIRLHSLSSGPRPRFHHHHNLNPFSGLGHHAHSTRFPVAMDASYTMPAAQLLAPPSMMHAPIQQVNPVKLLSDRFPLTSAPAYLVKLPTLTGGTITASGSLQTPLSKLNSRFNMMNRPPMALPPFVRFLGAGGSAFNSMPTHQVYQVPQRIRLISGPSVQTLAQASSPISVSPAHHVHPYTLPPAAMPIHSALYPNEVSTTSSTFHTVHHPTQPVAPPSQLYPSNHRLPTTLAASQNTIHNYQPSSGVTSLDAAHSVSTVNSVHPESSAGNHSPSSARTPLASNSNGNTNNHLSSNGNQIIGNQPASAATTALTRLQQATASLVELTSLASLVEEMVGGNDIETSPAAALANAINSISAAQNAAALSAQASSTSGASINGNAGNSNTSNDGSSSTSGQYSSQFNGNNQQTYHQPLAPGPSFWRNLLNPAIWGRDKTLLKQKDFSAIERFIAQAARRPPAARLKVKYIRVPVAVYETSNGNQLGEVGGNHGSQLVTKSQLAELVATNNGLTSGGGGGSHSLNGSSQPGVTFDGTTNSGVTAAVSAHPQPQSTGGAHGLPPSAASISSILGHQHPSGIISNTMSPPSSGLATTNPGLQTSVGNPTSGSGAASAASSNDFLFDEISSDSVPQLALALRDHYLAGQQQVAASDTLLAPPNFLPILSAVTANQQHHHKPTYHQLNSGALSPLESGHYYSLATPASLLKQQQQMAAEESNLISETKSEKSNDKRKRKRKKKKQYDDDEESDDDDEDDDDDLLSSKDLPVIESIISTIVHGAQGPQLMAQQQQQPVSSPASGLSSLFSRSRGSPFGSASSPVASYTSVNAAPTVTAAASANSHSILNPFAKNSAKFSIGEVVGALGARKIISSLLNKRKMQGLVTSKRVSHLTTKQTPRHSRHHLTSTPSGLDSNFEPFTSTTEDPSISRRFPPIAAYGSDIKQTTSTKRPYNDYNKGNKFHRPSSMLASTPTRGPTTTTTTSSTMDTPRLERVQDISVNRTFPSTGKDDAKTATGTTSTLRPTMTIFESTKNQASFLNKRIAPRGPPDRSLKPDGSTTSLHNTEQDVQFKFILKDHLQQPAPVKTLPQPTASHKQMAMPLYYVVADHYNKLHSGA